MCEPLMSDVMVPKAHQNNCSVCELSGPTFEFTTREFMGGYTKNHEKLQNCQNWGLWVWVLARDNTVLYSTTLYLTILHSTTCSTWLREFQYNTESRCTTAGTAVYCLAIRDMSNHRIRWLLSSGWFIASHCLYTGSGRSYPSSYLSQNGVSWLDEKFGIRRIRCTVI